MTNETKQSSWGERHSILAITLAIAAVIWTGGQAFQQLGDHDKRIDKLEGADVLSVADRQQLRSEMSRDRADFAAIKANVEWLVKLQGGEPKR